MVDISLLDAEGDFLDAEVDFLETAALALRFPLPVVPAHIYGMTRGILMLIY